MTTLADLGYETADLCRAIGVLGFLTYVANYSALSLRVLTSEDVTYFTLNIAAASMVMISLTQEFNLASALIQGFWIIIGAVAIGLRLRRRALVTGRLRERRL